MYRSLFMNVMRNNEAVDLSTLSLKRSVCTPVFIQLRSVAYLWTGSRKMPTSSWNSYLIACMNNWIESRISLNISKCSKNWRVRKCNRWLLPTGAMNNQETIHTSMILFVDKPTIIFAASTAIIKVSAFKIS